MIIKGRRIAMSIGVVAGICTHLFLSGMVPASGDIGSEYRSWWGNIFSAATVVFFISLILDKRWTDKIIEYDWSYREYSRNRDLLMDNLRFDDNKVTEALLLFN